VSSLQPTFAEGIELMRQAELVAAQAARSTLLIKPAAPNAFNGQNGDYRKSFGMNQAADAKKELLNECRAAVRKAALCRADRTSTADDSARYLESIGLPADALGNAAGSLFRGGDWEWTGCLKNSERESNHAHSNKVWRLK